MSDAILRRQSSNASNRPGGEMDMSLPADKKAKEEEKLPKPARYVIMRDACIRFVVCCLWFSALIRFLRSGYCSRFSVLWIVTRNVRLPCVFCRGTRRLVPVRRGRRRKFDTFHLNVCIVRGAGCFSFVRFCYVAGAEGGRLFDA